MGEIAVAVFGKNATEEKMQRRNNFFFLKMKLVKKKLHSESSFTTGEGKRCQYMSRSNREFLFKHVEP